MQQRGSIVRKCIKCNARAKWTMGKHAHDQDEDVEIIFATSSRKKSNKYWKKSKKIDEEIKKSRINREKNHQEIQKNSERNKKILRSTWPCAKSKKR